MITLSRRTLMNAFAGLGVSASAALMPSLSLAAAPTDRRLVIVFLRGGLDPISAVVPYTDPAYAGARNRTAIAPPGTDNGALDLDGDFGLHPALRGFHDLYRQGEMAVIQAIASPYRERSHFDAQDVVESGDVTPRRTSTGWLNRALAAYPRSDANRALAVTQAMPLLLNGEEAVSTWTPPQLPEASDDFFARVQRMYQADAQLAESLNEALGTREMAVGAMEGMGRQRGAAQFASLTRPAGALLRAEEGARFAVLDPGGWDTHFNQGGAQGQLATRLQDLDQGLLALKDSLAEVWSKTVVLVVTEFGRTVAENGTNGTDHGTGGVAFALGGAVRGGRILGDWPTLAQPALYQGRDLMPTTDMRSLFKTALIDHVGLDRGFVDRTVFPGSAEAAPMSDLVG